MKQRSVLITLPAEIEEYADDITAFVDVMIEKLHKNRHKGHWNHVSLHKAVECIIDETKELIEAIRNNDLEEIHREAADVANFALIVSSVVHRRNRHPQMELPFHE